MSAAWGFLAALAGAIFFALCLIAIAPVIKAERDAVKCPDGMKAYTSRSYEYFCAIPGRPK